MLLTPFSHQLRPAAFPSDTCSGLSVARRRKVKLHLSWARGWWKFTHQKTEEEKQKKNPLVFTILDWLLDVTYHSDELGPYEKSRVRDEN